MTALGSRGWVRGWLIAAGVALTLGAALDVHVHRPAPPSLMGDAVGIGQRRPFREHCGWFVVRSVAGDLPTGKAVCDWSRFSTAARIQELDQLTYHVLTRRAISAEHAWRSRDERSWQRELDSMRTALRRQGAVACSYKPLRWDIASARSSRPGVWELWHFPDFDVILTGGEVGSWPTDADTTAPWRWDFNLRTTQWRLCG